MDLLLSKLKEISTKGNNKIYIVGGYIRDLILDRAIVDIDCVVKESAGAIAQEFCNEINGSIVHLGNENKLYRVIEKESGINVDFTPMRGDSIEEDLLKRDFTINSLGIDILNIDDFRNCNIIDPVEGLRDLNEGTIKHTYDNAFVEDPLRMIRAVRLMWQLDFNIDHLTRDLIRQNKGLIKSISGERVANELFKILEAKKTYYYFSYMEKELDLLEEIFPEIGEMRDVGECKYHVVDSLTHSLYTLEIIEDIIYADGYFEDHIRKAYESHVSKLVASEHNRLSLIKLAAFFHDVGKPGAKKVDETGRVRFRGHEITGAELVKGIAERLKLSVKERKLLYKLIAKHMIPLVLYKHNDTSSQTLYGFFSDLKESSLDVLLIGLADILATRKLLDPDEEMGKYKIFIEHIANSYITRYKELEGLSTTISGRDVIENFHLGKEAMIGDILEEVRKAVFNGKIPMSKNAILKYVERIL